MYLISLTSPTCSYSILLISDRPISTRILSLNFIQYINVYSVFLSQLSYRRYLHTFLSPLKSSTACFSIYVLFCLFTIVYNMFSLSLFSSFSQTEFYTNLESYSHRISLFNLVNHYLYQQCSLRVFFLYFHFDRHSSIQILSHILIRDKNVYSVWSSFSYFSRLLSAF